MSDVSDWEVRGGKTMRWGMIRWPIATLAMGLACTLTARGNLPPRGNDPIQVVTPLQGWVKQNPQLQVPHNPEEQGGELWRSITRDVVVRLQGGELWGSITRDVVVRFPVAEQVQELPIQRRRAVLHESTEAPPAEAAEDEQLLRRIQLDPKDGKGLLDFIRKRTLKENELNQLHLWIRQFGADDFEERLRAVREVERYGAAAIGPLKATLRDSDPEVRYRAQQALQRLEMVPQSQVLTAVIRALQRQNPPGTVPTLLAFLPSVAEDETVVSVLRQALIALAMLTHEFVPPFSKKPTSK